MSSSIVSDLSISLQREWVLLRRQSSHLVNGFCFFMLVGLVYQIMLGPILMPVEVALCVLWVLALLSILLIADGWLFTDFHTGYYELWVSQGRSLWLLFFAKMIFQWVVISILMAVFSPILAAQLGIAADVYPELVLALIISSMAMICLCALGAAVTLGQASSGLLMAILVLPLNVPPMIFGAGAILERLDGLNSLPVFMLLLALALGSILLVPPLMSFCLRIMMD